MPNAVGGLFRPDASEFIEMRCQFERPFVLDSSAAQETFGLTPTDLDGGDVVRRRASATFPCRLSSPTVPYESRALAEILRHCLKLAASKSIKTVREGQRLRQTYPSC
jgi:hypothetical protein